ncbi:MAG: hypothetical protein JST66_08210 [Bacteroidetes bacterium]|nr:hypothetical protein [Bacteroidota bacterium]
MYVNTTLRNLSLLLAATALTFGACKKDDNEEPASPSTPSTPSNNGQASTTPTFPGANAALWAVNTYSTQSTPIGPISIEAGIGVAMFSNDGHTAFTSAGAITLNDQALTEQSNHAYMSMPSMTNPTGIDFSSGSTHWVVAGAGANPGFDRTPTNSFPTVQDITSAETVVKANGYTLTCGGVAGADSVIFTVGGVMKTLVGGNASCAFSASDLSSLSGGASIVQVAAYTWSHESIGGKDIYFGKETVRTKSVTIQ